MSAYQRSAFLRYLEEALAESRRFVPCCRFSRSSTGCFSRMFVMGRALFPGMEGTLIGADAVV
jgi:hypothetical protein